MFCKLYEEICCILITFLPIFSSRAEYFLNSGVSRRRSINVAPNLGPAQKVMTTSSRDEKKATSEPYLDSVPKRSGRRSASRDSSSSRRAAS